MAKLFSKQCLIKPLAYLMIRPMVPMMGNVEKTMQQAMKPEEARTEVEALRSHYGDLDAFGQGMIRSMSYFLHQNWQVTFTSLVAELNDYVDWAKFDPSIPFHINIGDGDSITAAAQPEI